MAIEFYCPRCDKLLKTADDKAGVRANCPGCGEAVVVPPRSEMRALFEPSFDPDAGRDGNAAEQSPLRTSRTEPEVFAGDTSMKTCPMCGKQILAAAMRCRFCGEALRDAAPSGVWQPHRGGIILALGLGGLVVGLPCSLFCLPFGLISLPLGIAAWVMGNYDLEAISTGRMDPSGESLTRAGKIVGIITCSLTALLIAMFLVMILVAVISNPR